MNWGDEHYRDFLIKKFCRTSVQDRERCYFIGLTPQLGTIAMLSESFVVSTQLSGKTPASSALKDVGVCIHELQPTSALRSTFKKTSTATNCLAVTPAHIYAAQAEKAVVHVYSRLRGNQEATVPFPERIRSIAAAGGANGEILVLGTEGGRLILWEVSEEFNVPKGHRV